MSGTLIATMSKVFSIQVVHVAKVGCHVNDRSPETEEETVDDVLLGLHLLHCRVQRRAKAALSCSDQHSRWK